MSSVITRFAPSPTGFLHIGGARTALFCWLFARHHGGKFLLRIEDTDRQRSTQEAVDAIYAGMKWLELDWDDEAVSQFERQDRHAAIAQALLEDGKAYRCYCSPQELEEMRESAKAEGRPMRYDGRWRNRDPKDAPEGVDPVIRIKAPQTGETTINDIVQGEVTVANEQLDDFVLLRSDGTPTYMLSVVVDDHDMDITHVIRGDDHLTNTFRQKVIYDSMGWDVPVFAHVPMIHGPDGKKLSKRHGALSVDAYREMGYLSEAMRNYLLRLGWSHGDEEIIPTEKAIEWFNLEHIGKSPGSFDFDKLNHINTHYMREADNQRLTELLKPFIAEKLGSAPDQAALDWIEQGMDDLIERAKTLPELADAALFYTRKRPLTFEDKAAEIVNDNDAKAALSGLADTLTGVNDFTGENIEAALKDYANSNDLKLGKVAMPFRAAITGTTNTPSIFNVAAIFGKDETLSRLQDVLLT